MELINNTTKTLKDDLSVEIKQGSKLSIAAACFSIYAFQELKEQLSQIEQLRFIFTSPTFVTEKAKKERREFYIPRLTRERSLYGTEFEIKLRNELTQKAIARECAEWIRQKVTFKSNVSDKSIQGQIVVDSVGYTPINNFTTVELGCEKGNVISTTIVKDESLARTLLADFNEIWNDSKVLQVVTDEVIDSITAAYNENSPDFIYFVTLYNIFNEFLEDVSEDVLPNEATGFKESKIWGMLYNFQKDAALAIINKLEKYNGCILADSVGLGKTFTALAVIKYYENRNKSVLVLCPKKLTNNWNTYKDNYVNNPIAADRLRYDVLYHTDLNRTHGTSNGLDLDRLNWGNYDLVVIDESHNFRNGGKLVENPDEDAKDNRYVTLMKKVIRAGVKTKVLMLSATPVNNRFNDLKNQLALAYEGHTDYIDEKLNTTRSIDEIFRNAQRAFNTWSKWEPCDRTTENLLKMLDFDFFEVLDSVTIARSRKHIQKYYDMADIGTFPTRLKPISLRPHLTDLKEAISYNEIFEQLMLLTLTIYTPTHYILPSKMEKYAELYGDNRVNVGFTQANREQGIRRLTAINLMKRMESSVYSFNLTLTHIKDLINSTIETIDRFDKHSGTTLDLTDISDMDEFDVEDQNSDELFSFGRKVKIDLADMDYVSWRDSLKKDAEVLELLTLLVGDITPEHDSKLQELFRVIDNKITHPINEGNKKLIIFTAFADTAGYLYDNVSRYVKDKYGLNTAMVSGSVEGRTTCPKLRADLNTVLTCFSPISKDKELLMPGDKTEIDVLIATDCISEGQNLQDCDYLINYDIHWNPVRIIQRFGRIDRIGSRNKVIQLVNFWPDVTLDDYINLKAKVETRMKIVDMTATGDDNLLSDEEKTDLEYRKAQLKRLQDEVVDIEDMTTGISIMDLGLNEFRLDLLDYIKHHPDIDKTPFGLHSVVPASEDIEMETGTGKTYVYIKTMFELNKKYGWSKFIVVVPSIAIREGVKKSFEITADHFMEYYGKKARFFIYNSSNLNQLDNFSSSSGINVMIINTQAFASSLKEDGKSKEARIIYSKRDEFGSRRPIDVIKANRPIIILDEPQKMGGDVTQKALKNFNPLFSLNYSATHAKHHNLVYVLDALDAFNKRLVKKIEVKGFEVKNFRGTDSYLYLEQIILSSKKPPMAKIELEIGYNKSINRETRILSVGDDLYFVSQEMEQYKGYTISEIDPLRGTVTFTNGEVIKAGDVVGDVSEKDMRRIQIRETILSHFEKEEKLFNMGIKCLSLFFIDEVAKYRQYDENGDEVLGEYGVMFEQEYLAILNEYITMFDTPYQKYLKSTCSDVSRVHKGYFSIDKKTGRSVDSQLKRGSEFSDDISAYDLILKNKERLLSFDEPTRFIFSHSALREGWDNPNVFQICTLKHSDSNTAKRQEVGRGLRLCVNQDGNRMDAQSCGDSVHEINTLTVVASESYKTFVTDLQSDIKTVLYDRPTVATSEYFKGKYVKVDDVPTLIDDEKANAIEFYLIQNGYVDMKRKVTDKYRQDVKNGTVAELPDELKPMTDGIHTLIQAVYDDSVLKDMFSDGHETKVKDNPLNENFAKKEFQALWREINHKYAYTVDFDSAELIRNAIAHIDKKLFVSELQYTTTIGRQKAEMNEYEIERGDSFTGEKTRTQTLKHAEASQIKYDLIGKIAEGTVLTRRTVSAILQGIRVDKLYMFRNNPEEFISKVIRLINEQKATMIVEHISYDTIEGEYRSLLSIMNSI